MARPGVISSTRAALARTQAVSPLEISRSVMSRIFGSTGYGVTRPLLRPCHTMGPSCNDLSHRLGPPRCEAAEDFLRIAHDPGSDAGSVLASIYGTAGTSRGLPDAAEGVPFVSRHRGSLSGRQIGEEPWMSSLHRVIASSPMRSGITSARS